MKRFLKVLVPFVMLLGILFSIGWYLLVYDREFTRDFLISQARFFDGRGNTDFAAELYDLAYDYTGKDDDVAIELASQYRADGNYTKAEYTLTNAIADSPSVDLYTALCKTYVEQDKLQDAVAMLDSIADPMVKMEIERIRPKAPEAIPDPGYYNQYITVEFVTGDGTLYCTTDREYPSLENAPFTEPITLSGGETVIYAIRVADNGLVSPLTIVAYTVGGVIEEAKFADPAMELAMREKLGLEAGEVVMTDQLWEITEFEVPADAQVLTDLNFLPYLEKLTIHDRKMESLTPLATLVNLKEVDLTGCRFPATDLKVLAGFAELEKLTLSNCALSTIADLAGAQKLTYLDLSRNTLRNLDPLVPMTTIQELYLQHNAVTALDALVTLSELNKLDVSYNSVTNLVPLAQCGKLTWLNASNNLIGSLSGIETFPALTHLDANHNQLTDVSVLEKCTGLLELNISNNGLKSIDALGKLTGLEKLNFAYNEVRELPTWPAGSALNTIDGSYNKIGSVYPLHNLEELTYVYLDYNQLYTVDPIADCFRLVMVNVYGNMISDVSKLTEHNIIVNYDPTTE